MRKGILLVLLTLVFGATYSQSIDNINLLNTSELHGTARFTGMGGAFTALGSDFSAIHINPAAASVFRKGEIGYTFGLQTQYDETSFLDSKNRNSNFRFNTENVGFVNSFGSQRTPIVFSVSLNKLAKFSSNFNTSAINVYNGSTNVGITLGEYWIDHVPDMSIQQMEQNGRYEEASAASVDILLVDSIGAYGINYYPGPNSNVGYSYEERGYHDELQISLGSRMSDRFFYGISLGLPYMNYSNTTYLTESGFSDSSYIAAYELERSNEVYANGVNVKLGVIFKPIQILRIGFAYQSPTWYNVNEVITRGVSDVTPGFYNPGNLYVTNDIRYGLTTPAKYRVGAALVLFRSMIFSLDYEYTDPSNINLSSRDGYNYLQEERDYINVTQASQTVKAGTELRFGPMFVRGGVQYRQSNFIDPELFISDTWQYSLGTGFGNKQVSVDIAYTWGNTTRNFFVHPFLEDPADPSRATVASDITKGNLLIGASLKF